MGYDVNTAREVLGSGGSAGSGERAFRGFLPFGLAVRGGELLGSLEFWMTPGGAVRVAMFGGDGRWARCAAAPDMEALGDLVCRWAADMCAIEPAGGSEPPTDSEMAADRAEIEDSLRKAGQVAEALGYTWIADMVAGPGGLLEAAEGSRSPAASEDPGSPADSGDREVRG
jgi:hypothetical protein